MNPRKKQLVWSAVALLAVVGLVLCLFFLGRSQKNGDDPEIVPVVTLPAEPEMTQAPEADDPEPGVECPVDFQSLQEENPDIYAWIQVPGTPIDYPIVQRFGDDSYYLHRGIDETYSVAGSLFTEYRYNSTSFSDPVTIVYGHRMKNGTMFGSLQSYMTGHELGEGDLFYIYLPDHRNTYQVFAAIPYDNSHILHYYNFHEEAEYTEFIQKIVSTRSLYANINEDAVPAFGDSVVILSTCLGGDNTKRFLVLGVKIQEDAVIPLS